MTMTGPLGLPWPTFAAFLVVAASVALSIVWSILAGRGDGGANDE